MIFDGIRWYSLVSYGIECYSMVFNDVGCYSMVFDEANRRTQEVPKSTHEYPPKKSTKKYPKVPKVPKSTNKNLKVPKST